MNGIGDASRLPADPIGTPEKLKKDLIKQILELQTRYRFTGPTHTEADLKKRSMRWLTKLCDHQLLAITLLHVPDKNAHSHHTPTESTSVIAARERAEEANLLKRPWPYGQGEAGVVFPGRHAPMGRHGRNEDVRQVWRGLEERRRRRISR